MTCKGRLQFFRNLPPLSSISCLSWRLLTPHFEPIRKFHWAEWKRPGPPNLVLIKNLDGYTFDKQMAGNTMCAFNNGDGDKWSVRKVIDLEKFSKGQGVIALLSASGLGRVDTK